MELSTTVTEVTLLEDRAQVCRVGKVTLPVGLVTLTLNGIAPVLSDRSLWFKSLSGPGGAKAVCADLRMKRRRRIVKEERPEEVRALEAEFERLKVEHESDFQLLRMHEAYSSRLIEMGSQLALEISQDAAWGRGSKAEWPRAFASLGAQERAARDKVLATRQRADDRAIKLADLKHRLDALRNPATAWHADLEVQLQVPAVGEYELQFGYVVPNACWRPAHEARLSGAGARQTLVFRTDAAVWQNTGEDWAHAQLSFSTQRPSLGLEPPVLSTDLLSVVKKQPVMQIEMREQDIQTTGRGTSPSAEVPGIDDGGVALALKSAAPARVPSDGRLVRVPLFQFEAPAQLERTSMAELAEYVFLRSVQANASGKPLLAGPVELIRDGGFTGRTALLFVAPGENFELNWGPDPALRVRREVVQLKPEATLLTGWTAQESRIKVRLSNLASESREIVVRERIPVSEVEQVEVLPDERHTTANERPNKDGFYEWKVVLKAHGQESLELRYTLRKKTNVVG